MKVRELLRTQSNKVSVQLRDLGQELLNTPLLTKGISCCIWAGLGAALSQAVIASICTPFGLGLVAAAGAGPWGLAALVGCCLGGIRALGIVGGLRCGAAAVLIFAASFAFYDLRIYQRRWFMPLLAAAMDAITGVVYLAEQSHIPYVTALFSMEVVLTGLSCFTFRLALTSPFGDGFQVEEDFSRWLKTPPRLESAQKLALLLLASILTAALSQITVEQLSLGRTIALAAVLTLGTYRSAETGVCVGVLFGFSADLMGQSAPYCTALFTLSGMAAGFAARRRRPLTVLCCEGAAVLISVAWQHNSQTLPMEALAASFLFYLMPPRLFRRLKEKPAPRPISPAVPAVAMLKDQLNLQAEAFQTLYDHLRSALNQTQPQPQEDDLFIFIQAADRVCAQCAMRSRCWQQEYAETCRSLRRALPLMLERGQASSSDFDRAFQDRCTHFLAFRSACSVEVSNLLAHRQYQARLQQNRAAVCRQYGELAQLLSAASAGLSAQPQPDPGKTRRLEEQLRALGTTARGLVAKDRRGHLYVELLGDDLTELDNGDFLSIASRLLELPLRRGNLTCDESGQRLTLIQQEPYTVSTGAAALPRTGNQVCGDTCCWFKGDDGILRVILCDGMGSGSAAAAESQLMVRLLEDLLRAGVEPDAALRTVNQAMGLRCDLGGGFSTVDLLTVDLFSRAAALYKLGAAPSYICRNGHVRRVAGGTFPAGLEETRLDVSRINLEVGDLLLLVSDGITDGENDDWLRTCLAQGTSLSAKGLSQAILQMSEDYSGGRDDRSVVVLRVSRRV